MEFGNPVFGDQSLIREQIRSPNYVAGSDGWSIRRDGSAEFADLIARGEIHVVSSSGSEINLITDVDGALISLTPPDEPGFTWTDAEIRALVNNANPADIYPFLSFGSPNEGGQPYTVIEMGGGSSDRAYGEIFYAADSHVYELSVDTQNVSGEFLVRAELLGIFEGDLEVDGISRVYGNWRVGVSRTAATSIAQNVTNTVSFTAVEYDVGTMFNALQPTRVTINEDGIYDIWGKARWASNISTNRHLIQIRLNGGATAIAEQAVYTNLASGFVPGTVSCLGQSLVAGDYLELTTLCDGSSATNVDQAFFRVKYLYPL